MTQLKIEPSGSEDSGPCACCGANSRTVWGQVQRRGSTEAAYFVQWTLGQVDRHGAHFDLIIGRWGDGTDKSNRAAVALEFRRTENGPSFMIIDASQRPVGSSDLAGRSLARSEVIGTPLAQVAFALVDAIWLQDERIAEVAGGGYSCRTCGAWHPERPTCFGADLPEEVAQLTAAQRTGRVDLSSDQCVLDGERFFVLGNLDLRVRGSDEVIRWILWSRLSRGDFERCSELWEVDGRESEPPYVGWLSNPVPGYAESAKIKVLIHTGPVGSRPKLEVVEEGHPLRQAQREGVTPQSADELIHFALCGGAD